MRTFSNFNCLEWNILLLRITGKSTQSAWDRIWSSLRSILILGVRFCTCNWLTLQKTLLILSLKTMFLVDNHETFTWKWQMNTYKIISYVLEISSYLCKFKCFFGSEQIFGFLLCFPQTLGRSINYNLQTSIIFFCLFSVIANIMTKYSSFVCLV